MSENTSLIHNILGTYVSENGLKKVINLCAYFLLVSLLINLIGQTLFIFYLRNENINDGLRCLILEKLDSIRNCNLLAPLFLKNEYHK